MKFEEKDNNIITLSKDQELGIIYFLIKKNEVVYVGQSKKVSGRPYDHRSDKDFDTIKILLCGVCNLDYMEDYFIYRYKPIYNIKNKAENPYTMPLIKKRLDVIFNGIRNTAEIKEIINEANLTVLHKVIPANSWTGNKPITQEYLTFEEYMKLVKFLVDNPKYGAILKDTEGFNIWDV